MWVRLVSGTYCNKKLKNLGLKPEDVTDVILTHAHYDHMVNWTMFSIASIHIFDSELDWSLTAPWGKTPALELYVKELAQWNTLKRIEPGLELLPVLVAHHAPGHTPGHLVFVLKGLTRDIIFTGDAAKNRAELLPHRAYMSLINAGCASFTANPVPIVQIGDDTKTCEAIINEMQQMNNAQRAAEGDRNSHVGGNVALGVLGAFLIVPWFFMDTSNAHTVQEKAAKARFERLQQMGVDRKCPAVPAYISPNQDKQQTGTEPTKPNSTSSVERIKISSQDSTTNVTNAPLIFEAARDNCSKTFKENTEQYGVWVLNSSKYKPAVVA